MGQLGSKGPRVIASKVPVVPFGWFGGRWFYIIAGVRGAAASRVDGVRGRRQPPLRVVWGMSPPRTVCGRSVGPHPCMAILASHVGPCCEDIKLGSCWVVSAWLVAEVYEVRLTGAENVVVTSVCVIV